MAFNDGALALYVNCQTSVWSRRISMATPIQSAPEAFQPFKNEMGEKGIGEIDKQLVDNGPEVKQDCEKHNKPFGTPKGTSPRNRAFWLNPTLRRPLERRKTNVGFGLSAFPYSSYRHFFRNPTLCSFFLGKTQKRIKLEDAQKMLIRFTRRASLPLGTLIYAPRRQNPADKTEKSASQIGHGRWGWICG